MRLKVDLHLNGWVTSQGDLLSVWLAHVPGMYISMIKASLSKILGPREILERNFFN